MGVQAIFYVAEVTQKPSGAHTVKMNVVAKGPYAEYSKYSPSGSFEITSVNDATLPWFQERIGKDVRVRLDDPTDADLITPSS
jgi:hypothetical protein